MATRYLQPSNGGFRQPTDNAQVNGRIINPPRYAEMGGLTGPGKAQHRNSMNIVPPKGTAK